MTASTAGKPGAPLQLSFEQKRCYPVLVNLDDTIVAIATPPGRGGIGVVRLAGPHSRSIVEPMLRLKHPLEPGRATFGELIEPLERGAGATVRVNAGVLQHPFENGMSPLKPL